MKRGWIAALLLGCAALVAAVWLVKPVVLALATWAALNVSTGQSATPPQAAGTPVFVSAKDLEIASDSAVAMDATGAATAVWTTGDKMWANQYSPGQGWGRSLMVDNDQAFGSDSARVVRVAPGHMLALWNRGDSEKRSERRYGVWSAVSTAQGAWSAAAPVSAAPAAMSTHHPRIAAAPGDQARSAVAVWMEWGQGTGPSSQRIMAALYTADAGWGAPVQISDSQADRPEQPEIAIDSQGQATAVWLQGYDDKVSGGSVTRVFYSTLLPGQASWSRPAVVWGSEPTARVSHVVVHSHAAGQAVLAWIEKEGKCSVVWAARWGRVGDGAGWQPPQRVNGPWPLQATQPRTDGMDYPCAINEISLAADAAGNALAGWSELSATSVNAYAAYSPAGQAWQQAVALPESAGSSASNLRMDFVSPGRAVVLHRYSQVRPDRSRIAVQSFDASNAAKPWGASQSIDWPDGSGAFGASLAVNTSGQAISSWRQSNQQDNGISAYQWKVDNAPATAGK